jgi:hypothetical protein
MDPDPGGPKTCGSGSGTLARTDIRNHSLAVRVLEDWNLPDQVKMTENAFKRML